MSHQPQAPSTLKPALIAVEEEIGPSLCTAEAGRLYPTGMVFYSF